MRTKILLGGALLTLLSAGCKSERQKMVAEWEEKICASKDHDKATDELLKSEKWFDEKDWTDADRDARSAAFDKANACVDKLAKK